jgi:hypothetical protein
MDDGSLVVVDAFSSYYLDIDGMKKLVASLSDRAKKEAEVELLPLKTWAFCQTII